MLQPALKNHVGLGFKFKTEVVWTEHSIGVAILTCINLLAAINQIVSRSSAHGEILDNVDLVEAMGNSVGMATKTKIERVQMEPGTNVKRLRSKE